MNTKRKPEVVLYRRKREQKTSYTKRMQLLVSRKPRVVVRFTNQRIIAQVIDFTTSGDKVVVGVNSSELQKQGWPYSCKNIPAAYLTGLLLGKAAQKKGYTEGILDTGFKTPLRKGKSYAFLKGVLDAGLRIPHGEDDMFPPVERLSGKHIQEFARHKNAPQFTQYLKTNAQPDKMQEKFEQLRKKLQ